MSAIFSLVGKVMVEPAERVSQAGKAYVTLTLEVQQYSGPSVFEVSFFGQSADAAAQVTRGCVALITGELSAKQNGKFFNYSIFGKTVAVLHAETNSVQPTPDEDIPF